MDPITLGNAQNFCGICSQELIYNVEKKVYYFREVWIKSAFQTWIRQLDPQRFDEMKLFSSDSFPKNICKDCYVLAQIANEFFEKIAVITGSLCLYGRQFINEDFSKLKELCRICLRQAKDASKLEHQQIMDLNALTGLDFSVGNFKDQQQVQKISTNSSEVKNLLREREFFPDTLCKECSRKLKISIGIRNSFQRSYVFLKEILDEKLQADLRENISTTTNAEESLPVLVLDDLTTTILVNVDTSVQEITPPDNTRETSIVEVNKTESIFHHNEFDDDADNDDDSEDDEANVQVNELINTQSSNNNTQEAASKKQPKPRVRKKEIFCADCKKYFRKKIIFDGHIKAVHEGLAKPFVCRKCPKAFKEYSYLVKHLHHIHGTTGNDNESDAKHDSNSVDTLASGSESPPDRVDSSPGQNSNEASPPATKPIDGLTESERLRFCNLCEPGKLFTRAQSLKGHILAVHQRILPHKCQFCDKTFARAFDRKLHEMTHTNNRPFICEYCSASYRRLYDLNNHKDNAHTNIDGNNPDLICPTCNKVKPTKEQLEKHMKSHNKRYPCMQCGKFFQKPSLLKDHVDSVHRKILKFKCGQCESSFSLKHALKRHENMHKLRARSQLCEICNVYFGSKFSLTVHMRKRHKNHK